MKAPVRQTKTLPNAWYFEQVINTLAQGKNVKIPVRGDSMRPFLVDGDVVELHALIGKMPKRGSIVLAYYNERYVLHRVVRRKECRIWMTGDGNIGQIEQVTEADVRAIVYKAFRGNRSWMCDTAVRRWIGIIWFGLRPWRRVWNKILKVIYI
ncbi:S24/S26 family peptidase [Sphingobacterium sp. DN00404]|uniref:S24/S26 family peptidase n=1 Tax=Sphingobacterium micropteri TaxID=2763501 RepID=A0ABR7YLQ0_9SPHI|nr:S24/S26 family peptidase [Sphingobacterium micropteri]MBD1432242.1 S24/S26 family peptidase [Sphingobacterium micropteri]